MTTTQSPSNLHTLSESEKTFLILPKSKKDEADEWLHSQGWEYQKDWKTESTLYFNHKAIFKIDQGYKVFFLNPDIELPFRLVFSEDLITQAEMKITFTSEADERIMHTYKVTITEDKNGKS